jgi:hypothetical protein
VSGEKTVQAEPLRGVEVQQGAPSTNLAEGAVIKIMGL